MSTFIPSLISFGLLLRDRILFIKLLLQFSTIFNLNSPATRSGLFPTLKLIKFKGRKSGLNASSTNPQGTGPPEPLSRTLRRVGRHGSHCSTIHHLIRTIILSWIFNLFTCWTIFYVHLRAREGKSGHVRRHKH